MATASGSAKTSTRTLWKGAISFGLVHIPVGLYSATSSTGIDFDWLDKRTMDPVGYKRINKRTGKDIDAADIVKGIEYEDGQYVILSPEEIAAAYPKTTQTIEIEAFIDADEIPFVYLERPYFIAPINRGEKVYALLREALIETRKVGIAKVVIATKQHLAVLIPTGPALVLNLLRWGGEIRSWEELKLPPSGAKAAGIRDAEMSMAKQLISELTAKWSPDDFRDSFSEAVMKLVEEKAQAGQLATVNKSHEGSSAPPPAGAQIVDLTELLRRSLATGRTKPASALNAGLDVKPTPIERTSLAKAPAKAAAKAPTKAVKPRKAA